MFGRKKMYKKGLEDAMDYLIRDPESIKRFYLIMARDTDARNVLQIVNPLESFPSKCFLYDSFNFINALFEASIASQVKFSLFL